MRVGTYGRCLEAAMHARHAACPSRLEPARACVRVSTANRPEGLVVTAACKVVAVQAIP